MYLSQSSCETETGIYKTDGGKKVWFTAVLKKEHTSLINYAFASKAFNGLTPYHSTFTCAMRFFTQINITGPSAILSDEYVPTESAGRHH